MKIIEKFFLFFSGAQFVLDDCYGNSYYILKQKDAFGRQIRYVKYLKKNDASSIPPLLAAWLRYSIEIEDLKRYLIDNKNNNKFHLPNLTGTNLSYSPTANNAQFIKKEKKLYKSWLD